MKVSSRIEAMSRILSMIVFEDALTKLLPVSSDKYFDLIMEPARAGVMKP